MSYDIYCLSFKNPKRKAQMEARFKQLEIECIFSDGVDNDDPRIANNEGVGWSMMLGALDIIQQFYNSDKEFGIFCEDDVYIHKEFKTRLPAVIEDFRLMDLDILLLGYLIPFEIKSYYQWFDLKSDCTDLKYVYHNYPNDLWGGQMILFSRTYAKTILDTYTIDYAIKARTDNTLPPFSGDHTITKNGNRAIIYPMLAVETADKISGHWGQDTFHENCKKCNYNPDIYI
jgi:hypothetical protein